MGPWTAQEHHDLFLGANAVSGAGRLSGDPIGPERFRIASVPDDHPAKAVSQKGVGNGDSIRKPGQVLSQCHRGVIDHVRKQGADVAAPSARPASVTDETCLPVVDVQDHRASMRQLFDQANSVAREPRLGSVDDVPVQLIPQGQDLRIRHRPPDRQRFDRHVSGHGQRGPQALAKKRTRDLHVVSALQDSSEHVCPA